MAEALTDGLQQLLKERRSRLNEMVKQAQATCPSLTGGTVLEAMGKILPQILGPVEQEDPGRLLPVLEAVFKVGLRMLSHRAIGAGGSSMEALFEWSGLLGACPRILSQDPERVAVATANAISRLATLGEGKAAAWSRGMVALGRIAQSSRDWLVAGSVMAWRGGLPQYRKSALQGASCLPADLGVPSLGLPGPLSDSEYGDLLAFLERHPWASPSEWKAVKPRLKVGGRVGGFAGFGGPFHTPPQAFTSEGRIFLQDDRGLWSVEADCFGVSLIPIGEPLELPKEKPSIALGRDGSVQCKEGRWDFPPAANFHSFTSLAQTLVVVPKDSHHAFVLGLVVA